MTLAKDTIIRFTCPLCKGNGYRNKFSRKKVCSDCGPELRKMVMTGKRWRTSRKIEEERIKIELEQREKSAHRETIFTSQQYSFYMMPEGDLL